MLDDIGVDFNGARLQQNEYGRSAEAEVALFLAAQATGYVIVMDLADKERSTSTVTTVPKLAVSITEYSR